MLYWLSYPQHSDQTEGRISKVNSEPMQTSKRQLDLSRFLLVGQARGLLSLLILLLPLSAWAQSELTLVSFADADSPLSPPTFAAHADYVSVNRNAVLQARSGSLLAIQIAADQWLRLQVTDISSYINGDRVLQAESDVDADFHSLTVTLGQNSLFGHLNTSTGIYQLYATGSRTESYTGWLYRPLVNKSIADYFVNDYVIPEAGRDLHSRQLVMPSVTSPPQFQLQANGIPEPGNPSGANATTQAQINEFNFLVEQQVSKPSVLAGQTVDVKIRFENVSTEFHQNLFVEFFFVLENTNLLSVPTNCLEQISLTGQIVLHCEIGDFEPGETKEMTYSVLTDEASKPNVISTAIVGNLRVDSFVNVVDDIITDSDADGVSDFNEAIAGTDAADPLSVDNGNVVIDVMALYTQGASDLYAGAAETKINQLVSVANQVYRDSGVGITLRPVHHALVEYNDVDDMDTALNHLIDKTDLAFAEVDALRQTYGADLVMLFRPSVSQETSRCGLAPVGGIDSQGDFSAARESGYSHIAIDCPVDLVVAHELGHNMGLTHSYIEDGRGGTFSFSTGYGIDSQFVTVMALPAAFNTQTRVARFSSPLLDCLGFVCGVDGNGEFGADAARSLDLVKYQIAAYFPSRVPNLPLTNLATIDGLATTAQIAIAASVDEGLSFTQSLTPDDIMDVSAEVYPELEHVGKDGFFHVLIEINGQDFLQMDDQGNAFGWDGTVEGLIAYNETHALRVVEHINVMDGFRADPSIIGQSITIYVAYQVPELPAFIYTSQPLIVDVIAALPSTDSAVGGSLTTGP